MSLDDAKKSIVVLGIAFSGFSFSCAKTIRNGL